MSLSNFPLFAPASKVSRLAPEAGRHAELRAGFLRELHLGRRPTVGEAVVLDQACRLVILAEQVAVDPHTSLEDRIRTERAADGVVRRLMRLARPKPTVRARAGFNALDWLRAKEGSS